jgi:O-antigen/teichoic acid export membrane protein
LFLGTTRLGFYNFSKQVLGVFNNVVAGSLGAVAHPMFSGIQNDIDRVRKGFLSATFFSSLVAFPMFTGLALVSPKIVPLAFGARWLPVVPLVQLQCSLGLLTCIGTLQFGVITSQGKANWWFYYQLLQTVMTAFIIIIFARFGLVVMLSVIVIKGYVLWFIPVRNSLKLLSMKAMDYLLNFRTPVTGTLLMGLAVLAINSTLKAFTNMEMVLLDVLIGILVYGLTVVAVDASRIQALVALVVPKFKKSMKTT